MKNNLNLIHEKYESYFNEEILFSEEKTSSWGIFKKIRISFLLFLYVFLIKDFHIFANFKNPKYYSSAKGAILTFYKKEISENSNLVRKTNTLILLVFSFLAIILYLIVLYFVPFYSFTSSLVALCLILVTSISFVYMKNSRQRVFAASFKAIKSVFKNNSVLTYYYMKEKISKTPLSQDKLSFLLNSDIKGKDYSAFRNMLVGKNLKSITLKDLNKFNVDYLWKRNEKLDFFLHEKLNIK